MDKRIKIGAIIAGVVIVFILGIIMISSMIAPKNEVKSTIQQAYQSEEDAYINVAKAYLNMYYALEGRYPFNKADLIDRMTTYEESQGEEPTVASKLDKIKDFDYSVRGDRQAYKFTYKGLNGEIKSVEGNYKEEYH